MPKNICNALSLQKNRCALEPGHGYLHQSHDGVWFDDAGRSLTNKSDHTPTKIFRPVCSATDGIRGIRCELLVDHNTPNHVSGNITWTNIDYKPEVPGLMPSIPVYDLCAHCKIELTAATAYGRKSDNGPVYCIEHEHIAFKVLEYNHYFKDVSKLQRIDVYRVLELFSVTDPCIQHAIKKLLVAGGRGSKDIDKDIEEAIVSLKRFQEMKVEDK